MEKITTAEALVETYTSDARTRACTKLGFLNYTDENFWAVREQCRMLSGEYNAIFIPNDDLDRFLHVSTDNPDMVAYTKDVDKGRADIQTRTTLAAYCTKFGLQEPGVATADTPTTNNTVADKQALIRSCVYQLDITRAQLVSLLG